MAEAPTTLRDLQRWVADAILASDTARAEGGPFAPPPRGTRAERLHAYVDGYPARVREALAEAFPAVEHIVGAGAFGTLARRYLPRVPGGIYSLTDVGSALPSFLATDALGDALPFLPDLARLEWAVQRAFHAHLEPPFDATTVSAWGPDDWAMARVRFQPGTACVGSRWPIRALWDARKMPRDEIDVALEDRPETVVVYRVEHRVACEPVDPEEARVLGRLLSGATLGDATADLSGDDAERLGGWTAGWVARGLVVACERCGS